MVKEDILKVFMEFHNSEVINQSTNATFIALLSKKSQTVKILDFRPISLATSLYKILTRVLLGCIRRVLHEILQVSQGAFVKGRQILHGSSDNQ